MAALGTLDTDVGTEDTSFVIDGVFTGPQSLVILVGSELIKINGYAIEDGQTGIGFEDTTIIRGYGPSVPAAYSSGTEVFRVVGVVGSGDGFVVNFINADGVVETMNVNTGIGGGGTGSFVNGAQVQSSIIAGDETNVGNPTIRLVANAEGYPGTLGNYISFTAQGGSGPDQELSHSVNTDSPSSIQVQINTATDSDNNPSSTVAEVIAELMGDDAVMAVLSTIEIHTGAGTDIFEPTIVGTNYTYTLAGGTDKFEIKMGTGSDAGCLIWVVNDQEFFRIAASVAPGSSIVQFTYEEGVIAFDFSNQLLQSVGAAVDNSDAVNKSFLDSALLTTYFMSFNIPDAPIVAHSDVDFVSITTQFHAVLTSLPTVVASGDIVVADLAAGFNNLPDLNDDYDYEITVLVTNMDGTQQLSLTGVGSFTTPGNFGLVWTDATPNPVAGTDLTWDPDAVTITSAAGGIFMVRMTISGSAD